MLKEEVEIVNEYLANLKHYNKRVAESWYRVRDFAEEKFTSDNKQNLPCEEIYDGCSIDGAGCNLRCKKGVCRYGVTLKR